MSDASRDRLEALLGPGMFELVPFNVAVIDRAFSVVAANRNFEEYFGEWRGARCYEVFKNVGTACTSCHAAATFEDGRTRVSDETGVDRQGRPCHYVVHLAPLKDDRGIVQYVIEMTTDLTETRRWQREYDLLFERVPCYVSVIDRDFRITRANERLRTTFGETEGRRCYEVYKRRRQPCVSCPAQLTFQDGRDHVAGQYGVHRDGTPAYYVVTTSPLSRGRGGVAHVIEISTDVTDVRRLKDTLARTQDFYESLVRHSATGVLAMDTAGGTRLLNPAARALLGLPAGSQPPPKRLREMLPPAFFDGSPRADFQLALQEMSIQNAAGEAVPVQFSAVSLKSHRKALGRAAFMQDLRPIKQLEKEKLEAERLGAVGETVAGLAHTIKNLLMALEGGMYLLDSGLRKADVPRITEGWQILQRNLDKTTAMVRGFLGFAKGRLPEFQIADPNEIARVVVDLYREAARRQDIDLVLEADAGMTPAPLDPAGIESCLTNLVSNGIDAALLRRAPGGRVVVRTRHLPGEVVYEVADNGCGMDPELEDRVFTTFFTTKGNKGTGLGLLTTRKIVQEHGGRIDTESSVGEGSVFRIRLPRARLEALASAGAKPAPALGGDHGSRPADSRAGG
jgi:signal transduction histidine kinase